MKTKLMSWMLACLCAIVMMTSCADSPKSAELIPDDAVAVLSIDAAGLYHAGALDENEDVKDNLLKLVDKSGLSKKTRNFLEEVVNDPAKSGVDLESPMMIFGTEHPSAGLVGAVADAADFTEFLNTLGKEAGDEFEKVDQMKQSGLNYAVLDEAVVMFDDEKFVVFSGEFDDVDDILDEAEGLFEQGAEKSIVSNESYQKMIAQDGQVKALVEGEVMELAKKMDRDVRRAMKMVDEMYGDLDFAEIAYIAALNITDGEVALTCEVLPETEEMKKFIEENAALTKEIEGTHLAYVPEDVLFIAAANVNGEEFLQKMMDVLEKSGVDQKIPAEIKKAARTVDGDITYVFTDMVSEDVPAMALYAATTDNTIVDMVAEETGVEFQTAGKDAWSYPMEKRKRHYLAIGEEPASDEYVYTDYATDERYVYRTQKVAEVKFGYKDNVSYVMFDKNPKPMEKAENAMSGSDVKGKKFYACFRPEALLKMGIIKEQQLDKQKEFKDAKTAIELFDKVEYYNEGDTKAVLRVVMKDKSQSPIKVIYDTLVPMVKKYM